MRAPATIAGLAALLLQGCAHGALSPQEQTEFFTCNVGLTAVRDNLSAAGLSLQMVSDAKLATSPLSVQLDEKRSMLIPAGTRRQLNYVRNKYLLAVVVTEASSESSAFTLYLNGHKLSEISPQQMAHDDTRTELHALRNKVCGADPR